MRKIFMLMLIPAMVLVACGKDGSSGEPTVEQAERMKVTAEKICEKFHECMNEQLAALPASQREMARSMMPSPDSCYREYGVPETDDTQGEPVAMQFTEEEVNLAIRCMEAITEASCQQLMQPDGRPAACKEFAAIAEKKAR